MTGSCVSADTGCAEEMAAEAMEEVATQGTAASATKQASAAADKGLSGAAVLLASPGAEPTCTASCLKPGHWDLYSIEISISSVSRLISGSEDRGFGPVHRATW